MAQQVFPTKSNLMATKRSLALATQGYDLMDRKRNILVREMMQLIDRAAGIQDRISAAYAEAYEALKKANIMLGSVGGYAAGVPVERGVQMSTRSVMGVELPTLRLNTTSPMGLYYDLESTNGTLDVAYLKFNEVKTLTVELAEVETSVIRLAEAIQKTQKRANALGNVQIPQMQKTIKSIDEVLGEREREELEACLNEMALTDEEREEVEESLLNLTDRNVLLRGENDSLRIRLKEYEKRPLPREAELLEKQNERICLLDKQVQTLTSTLIDRDDVVERLRRQPKFLSDKDWEHLTQLANRVYSDFTNRLATRFPSLTAADLQLCLLIRLRFTNAQVATLIAVSPASVSQQKFRLKKRLMQEEETLFKDGETVDGFVWGY